MTDISTLDELMRRYNNLNNSSLSFFEIINIERNETIISLMLKYLFENDKDCLKCLINKVYDKNIKITSIENVITEYFIYEDKRIDILIEGKAEEKDIIVVIENKIDSHEHNNQCQKYYDYIENKYNNISNRYYLYLKPSYNLSTPTCHEFKIITYEDIYNYISNEDDIYIQDFKKCIERNYMNNKKNDLELYILKNFNYFYKMVNELHKEFERFFQYEAAYEVQKALGCEKTEFYSNTHYTLRFYDEDCRSGNKENKDDMYYFYIEIVAHDKKVNKFKFCRVIQAYTKNYNSKINRFAKANKSKPSGEYGKNIWYVAGEKIFKTDESILSSEWKKELIEAAKIELKKMYNDMCKCVEEFKVFK